MTESRSKKVYVIGGYIPNGGTYMMYHLGRILHRRFDRECVIVKIGQEGFDNGIFNYPDQYDTVDIPSMERDITKDDILIATPSFSPHLFGLRLSGTKIMYIQGYNTYAVIDGFFDHYVCASQPLQRFLQLVYDFVPPIIPLFIHLEDIPKTVRPWSERPAEELLVVGKIFFQELLQEFQIRMKKCHSEINYKIAAIDGRASHEQLLQMMCEHRFFMGLSPGEGFSLMPLEAMACGSTVLGFHGFGGAEYMKDGINCEVVSYPHLNALVDKVANILRSPDTAQRLAHQGSVDARQYGYDSFERRWVNYFTDTVKL